MRKVTCKDCGRSYDYDKDDFCPKCGSFNPPACPGVSGAAVRPQAERPQAQSRTQTQTRPQQVQTQYRYGGKAALDWDEKKPGKNAKLGVFAIVLLAAALVAGLVYLTGEGHFQSEPQVIGYSYEAEGYIDLGPLHVELDDLREIRVSGESSLYQAGYGLLALDVYITGGGEVSRQDAVGSVYLELPDGRTIPALDEALKAKRLRDQSEYPVVLSDARWEDPLLGSFVFYVPYGTETAVLTMEEAKGSVDKPQITVLHQVRLTLPEDFGA